jgi:hypothetical protein
VANTVEIANHFDVQCDQAARAARRVGLHETKEGPKKLSNWQSRQGEDFQAALDAFPGDLDEVLFGRDVFALPEPMVESAKRYLGKRVPSEIFMTVDHILEDNDWMTVRQVLNEMRAIYATTSLPSYNVLRRVLESAAVLGRIERRIPKPWVFRKKR